MVVTEAGVAGLDTLLAWILLTLKWSTVSSLCLPQNFGSTNYLYCLDTTTRSDAVTRCAAQGNYTLIVMETQAEFDYFAQLLRDSGFESCWVGAMFNFNTFTYTWDGTDTPVPNNYFEAGSNPPFDFDCVHFNEYYPLVLGLLSLTQGNHKLYVDQDCSTLMEYLCEEIPPVTTEGPTTLEPTTEPMTTTTTTTASPFIIPTLPTIALLNTTISVPTLPSIINVTVPSIENLTLPENLTVPTIPTVDNLTVPTIPTVENLTIPTVPTVENLTVPTISILDNLTVPTIPTVENLTVPTIPILENLTLPSLANLTLPTLPPLLNQTLPPLTDLNTIIGGLLYETCSCGCPLQIPTDEVEKQVFVEEEVEKIQKSLTVEKETLSSTTRKKSSAEDDRPSAQSVGLAGIVVLAVVFGSILVMDLTYCARPPEKVKGKGEGSGKGQDKGKDTNNDVDTKKQEGADTAS